MGETCCLRLMQADGMNDNLTGNPAMPPPHRHDCSGQRGNHREAPVCPLAAGMGITGMHPFALTAAGMGITDRHPSAHPAAGTGITAATRLPTSKNNRYRQTAVKAALAIFLFI